MHIHRTLNKALERRAQTTEEILERYSGYEVYDRDGEKIGKVDELFLDENDQPEYLGVKMGFLGLEGTGLIPWEAAWVNEGERRIEVSTDKETVKNGPSYGDDEEITPEYEERIRSHYGLGRASRGVPGSSSRAPTATTTTTVTRSSLVRPQPRVWLVGNAAKRERAVRRPARKGRLPGSATASSAGLIASARAWTRRRGAPVARTR